MKTFTEQLRIRTSLTQLHEAFVLMSRRGVDPMRFVDWYTLDGLEKQNQGLLNEATEEWLVSEGLWDKIKQGASWVGQGAKDIATGNVDYGAMGDRWKKAGAVVGNVATALPAAGMAMAGGAARGLIGAGAKNLAGGAMGGLGLGGNNATPPNGEPGAKPGANPPGGGQPGEEKPPEAPADPNAQHIEKAHTALDTLSKRMGNSKNLAQELGGQQFQSMVANLLYMLKNNQAIQPAEAQPVAAPTAAPKPDHSAAFGGGDIHPHSESNGFHKFTGKIRLKNEIKTGLRELQEYRINPVEFVEWYAEEGQYLAENAVGDWFGRQWAGLGGAFSGKGYSAAGQEWQQGKDKKRDDDAVQQAVNTLWQFEREMKAANVNFTPDFAETLNKVRDGLHKRSGMAGGQADPNAEPPKPEAAPTDAPPPPPADAETIEKEAPAEGVSEEQLKGYTPMFQQKLQAAGADMSKFADPAALAELAKQALSITRKDGHRDAFIKHVAGGGDPKTWTPPASKDPVTPASPPPAPQEPGGEGGSSSSAETPRFEGTFYRYLKRRA